MATITNGYLVPYFKILIVLSIEIGYFHGINAGMKEHCFNEKFNPKCSQHEIIVMKHAIYGRMQLGKCVLKDRGNLGCQTDVLNILQRKCSNKEECYIDLVQDLHANRNIEDPCDDRSRYLEVDYMCIPVLQVDAATCKSGTSPVDVPTSITISSQKMYDANCGSSSLIIFAQPGQILNISITDFSWDESYNPARSCVNYMELEDLTTHRKTHVCAGTVQERHLLSTTSNQIKVNFQLQDPANQQFLLRFQAQGCADIISPEGTWVQRRGEKTTLGCHHGDHTWTLTCQNNQWRGAVGSCGTGFTILPKAERKLEQRSLHIAPGMLIFAAISLLMFVSACSFTIAVCVYSKRNNAGYKQQGQFIIQPSEHLIVPTLHTYPHSSALTGDADGHQVNTVRKPKDHARDEVEYMNTNCSKTDSMHSDPVKYYVLENVAGK